MALSWLCDAGGRARALAVRQLGAHYGEQTARWARAAADPRRRELSALHELARARVASAAAVLSALARDESASLERMTVPALHALLSL